MPYTQKKLPGSKVELQASLTEKEFEPFFARVKEAAVSAVHIKGFRPGSAPEAIANDAINWNKVFEKAALEAVQHNLDEVRSENNWVFVAPPKVTLEKSKEGEAIRYRADLTLFPTIELGDYKAIAKKVFESKKEITIPEKDIAQSLEWIRESRAKITSVPREAKLEDLIEADIKAEADGKPIAGATLTHERFILGKSNFVPGFDEMLVGKKSGETAQFTITAPKNYPHKELQNKEITFTVTLYNVFLREVPEEDDTFATSLGTQFKTIDNVKKSIREGLTQERGEKEKERLRIAAIDAIAKNIDIDIPEIMIDKTLERMAEDTKRMINKPDVSIDDLKNELRPKARENVAYHLIIHAISETEMITPTDEEIKDFITKRSLDPEKDYDYTYSTLQSQKVFELLEGKIGTSV